MKKTWFQASARATRRSALAAIVLVGLLFDLVCIPSPAQEAGKTKEQLIDELYEVHGVGKMPFEAYCQWKETGAQFQQLSVQFPQIVKDDWRTLFRRLYDADQPPFKKQFSAFMSARFDATELAQINSFYASSAGKKMLSVVPEIFSQIAQARTDVDYRPIIHEWYVDMQKKYQLK